MRILSANPYIQPGPRFNGVPEQEAYLKRLQALKPDEQGALLRIFNAGLRGTGNHFILAGVAAMTHAALQPLVLEELQLNIDKHAKDKTTAAKAREQLFDQRVAMIALRDQCVLTSAADTYTRILEERGNREQCGRISEKSLYLAQRTKKQKNRFVLYRLLMGLHKRSQAIKKGEDTNSLKDRP